MWSLTTVLNTLETSGQARRARKERKGIFGHEIGLEKSEEVGPQRISLTMVQKGKLSLVDYV